ncbi:MAG: tetratricopeptide repeat protein, partial [Planctomycetes bacterium]|nr:tetratricopeptide repeat protein [Planctomycetota bacterium]
KALIAELLASPSGASEGALLRIAVTAARARLGSVDPILARCEKLHGVTPRLAMTTAVLQGRGPDAGLAAFDAMRARAGAGGAAADWDVARAGLLEAAGRPEAAAAWGAVADANPASVAIQLAALSAKSMWTDPKAVARAADRLKELTGETGVMWRLSRARLLLQSPDASDKDAAEAAELLSSVVRDAPDNVHAHILLSRALQLTGDAAGIEAHLQEALRLAPGNTSIALDLARLAQSRGDTEEARRRIETVLAAKSVDPQEAEGAAYILAAQGDLQRSADLLQRLVREQRADASATLELSRLYARAGRVDEAIRMSESLLDAPTAQVVEHTAGLYASVGRTADSDRLIRALDTLQLPAGEADLVRARHAARWGSPGAATAAYRAAVVAAPARADAWSAFAEHAVAIGDKSVLSETLDDPRAAAADPVAFARSIRALCEFALADPGLRQLLLGAMRDPAQRPAVTAALRAIAQDWSDPAKRASTAKTVRALAEANVKFVVLQMVAVDLCAQTTERNSALEFSRRTAAAFPNNAEAAHQWAELLASAGRWSEALDAARTWRDRADPRDAAPDELIARVLLRLGRGKEAAVALAPRVAAALARPQADEAVLVTHAVTLLRTGDVEGLQRLLRQLAAASERWRSLPLSVGPDFLGTPAEAVAWLRACAELVPQDDTTTRIFLAQAWIVAWKSLRTPELLAESKKLLAEILASPQPPATAHFLAGTLAEASGDTAAAEAAYGSALRANPEFGQARNNLAMLLADGGRWQDAVDHARRVVAASPRSPQALDTLAHALRAGEKFDEARTRIGEAIRLDPVNPAWQVELAETLADARDADALNAVLQTIRSMEEDGVVLSRGLKERIERVRLRQK